MKKLLIALFIVGFLMVPFVEAAVTVSNRTLVSLGNKRMRLFDVAFDSSYPAGGESLSIRGMGFSAIDQVQIQAKDGYTFEYDTSNNKIKAFSIAPAIVYEEAHTATAYESGYSAIVLDYPAAWIINITDHIGNQKLVKTGMTTANLGADEACLFDAIADGTRTVITVKTNTTYYVTYATQAWSDLYSLLVQAEAVTLTGSTANALSYTPLAIGYVNMNTNSDNLTPVPTAYTINSGYIGVNPGQSGTTAFNVNSAQNTYTVTVLYLKRPDSGWIYDRIVDRESPTDAASGSYSKSTFDFPMLLPTVTGTILGYTTTQIGASVRMGASYTSVSGGYAHTNWVTAQTVATGSAPAAGQVWAWDGDALAGSQIGVVDDVTYLKGYVWEIPNLKPIEVKNGANLSGVSGVKFMVIGR